MKRYIKTFFNEEEYRKLRKTIFSHHSKIIPDFVLSETDIVEVLKKTLNYYENTLINCDKENKELHKKIKEQEKQIHSLIQGSVHIKTLEEAGE